MHISCIQVLSCIQVQRKAKTRSSNKTLFPLDPLLSHNYTAKDPFLPNFSPLHSFFVWFYFSRVNIYVRILSPSPEQFPFLTLFASLHSYSSKLLHSINELQCKHIHKYILCVCVCECASVTNGTCATNGVL